VILVGDEGLLVAAVTPRAEEGVRDRRGPRAGGTKFFFN